MKRNAILHGVGALCSALVYVFFALPFYTIKISPKQIVDAANAAGIPSGSTNGYEFLETALKQHGNALSTFTTIMALLVLILAGVAFLASVFALLNDLKVIKNQTVSKVANWIAFCATVALALVCILNLIGNACFVANEVPDRLAPAKAGLAMLGMALGISGASISAVAGWALTIITTVLGLGAVVTSTVAKFKK